MTLQDKNIIYIDVTNGLTLGLLDSNFKWLKIEQTNITKSSSLLFSKINDLLNDFQLDFSSIKAFCFLMGPGSYTGLRLVQGMMDFYGEIGKDVYGFYSFEVPELLGHESGEFLASAYKGETFIYEWSPESNQIDDHQKFSLLTSEEFARKPKKKRYSHRETEDYEIDVQICELIQSNPKDVFEKVIENNLKRRPYYFRPLEKEFSVNYFPKV